MNDEVTEEKEKTKVNGSKKKRIAIIIIIAVVVLIAIIAIVTNVTISSTAGDDTENLATLKVASDGSYELTVVNYASNDVGEQNFIIQKTDEYSNPLEGVEFEVVGNFRTSYSVEYLKATDDEGTNFDKLDEYTQVFYDSCWDERYFTTDSNGNISLTLQYGDYVVAETGELYGYDKNDTNYCIRVDKSGISLIDEEDVSWEDPNFDEESVLRVRTASIEDQIGNIEGVAIDYIEINGEKIGTEIDDLPEEVEDETVIKIYLKNRLYYTIEFIAESIKGSYYYQPKHEYLTEWTQKIYVDSVVSDYDTDYAIGYGLTNEEFLDEYGYEIPWSILDENVPYLEIDYDYILNYVLDNFNDIDLYQGETNVNYNILLSALDFVPYLEDNSYSIWDFLNLAWFGEGSSMEYFPLLAMGRLASFSDNHLYEDDILVSLYDEQVVVPCYGRIYLYIYNEQDH